MDVMFAMTLGWVTLARLMLYKRRLLSAFQVCSPYLACSVVSELPLRAGGPPDEGFPPPGLDHRVPHGLDPEHAAQYRGQAARPRQVRGHPGEHRIHDR